MNQELIKQVSLLKAAGNDIDAQMAVIRTIQEMTTSNDIPYLIKVLGAPDSDFWVREMLSEPIARIGGSPTLHALLEAFDPNPRDGHDNDSFEAVLIELLKREPSTSRLELLRIKDVDPRLTILVDSLLEYCQSDK